MTPTKIIAEIQAKSKNLGNISKHAKTGREQLRLIREFKHDINRFITKSTSRHTTLTRVQWTVLDMLIKLSANQRFGYAVHQALKSVAAGLTRYSLSRLEAKAFIKSVDRPNQSRQLFKITKEGRDAHKLLAELYTAKHRKTKANGNSN